MFAPAGRDGSPEGVADEACTCAAGAFAGGSALFDKFGDFEVAGYIVVRYDAA